MGENKKTLFNNFTLAVLFLVAFVLLYTLLLPKPNKVKVTFYDVGQGDSAFISTPSNQYILIDGGPNGNVVSKVDRSLYFYQHSIDAVVLTHPHADHLVGLIDVLKKYEVKKIYSTGVLHTTPEYIEFLEIVRNKKIPLKVVKSGDNLDFGDDFRIDFLFPSADISKAKVDNLNNTSVVLLVKYGESKILFTGDIEIEGQDELISKNITLAADILKVPHHGSKDSLNLQFLKNVAAKYAVISVGSDNKFGHPSPSVLSALSKTMVYRTDQDGDVIFELTKAEIKAKNP